MSQLLDRVQERCKRMPVKPGQAIGCLEWQGATGDRGYGRMWVNGRLEQAHRVAYAAAIGGIDTGLVIMHSCDNPPCCELTHLEAGTIAENNRQARERGLWFPLHGEDNGSAKLSSADVLEIWRLKRLGDSCYSIAHIMGVSHTQVHAIVTGKKWRQFSTQAGLLGRK